MKSVLLYSEYLVTDPIIMNLMALGSVSVRGLKRLDSAPRVEFCVLSESCWSALDNELCIQNEILT